MESKVQKFKCITKENVVSAYKIYSLTGMNDINELTFYFHLVLFDRA